MCKWGSTTRVKVKIPADLSHTGKERMAFQRIDSCIAPIVRALQIAGIDMRGSCCGHNKCEGDIHLQDGRALIILDKKTAQEYMKRRRRGSDIRSYIRSEFR